MSIDLPDYTRKIHIYAWDGENLVPVRVDAAGRIMMVPYGATEVTGELDVSQTDKAREIQGKDGVTLRSIAVDGAGNIVAVIKGEYSGALKTVAINEKGYMLIKQLPILTFDACGDVHLFDGFENGIDTWINEYVGDTSTFALSSTKYKNGGFSALLTAGSASGNYMNIARSTQILTESKIGMEFSFAFSTVHAIIDFVIGYYDGVNIYQAEVKFNTTDNTLSIINSDGDPVTISGDVKLYKGLSVFHTTKLVIDLETKKYDKIIINNQTFDLSDYNLLDVGNSIWKYLAFSIKLQTTGAGTTYAWIDDVIITQNEP